ncbi:MAG: DUF1573 domain-containing protein [Chitinophagales bacterium]
MKYLSLLFAAAVMITTAQAQATDLNLVSEGEEEVLVFESMTIDYGTVTKGDQDAAVKQFTFTNKGNSPVIIGNCKGSCGCTVPQCPKEPVMPGATGTIDVKYDVNRVGPFTKNVTVNYSYNGEDKTVRLTIKGTVEQ